jgi:hypothetical protein
MNCFGFSELRARAHRACRVIRPLRWSVRRSVLLAATLLMSAPACGNYSNEDLEFMSAIPQTADVELEVPRRGLLVTATAAEGWRTTLEVTRTLNRTAGAFLALIDKIRAHAPTRRLPDERIWGPVPADEHPGWLLEFRMRREPDADGVTTGFRYALLMIPPTGVVLAGGSSTQIMGGSFEASGGARIGAGQLIVTLEEGRAAGLEFKQLESLRKLTIDYSTRVWPRMVTMTVENVPNGTDPVSAVYAYERAENGDGAMTFTTVQDVVASPVGTGPLMETLMVHSRWLGTGPGRVDSSISGGDLPGVATAVECWGDDYRSSYKFQSWAPADASGLESTCVSKL